MKKLYKISALLMAFCLMLSLGMTAFADAPVVTKDPSGETTDEGGYVYFIARADNAESMTWILFNDGESAQYTLDEAASLFGISYYYDYDNPENLVISNLPYFLTEYKVAAQFKSSDGTTVLSARASIHVNKRMDDIERPVITGNPVAAELTTGQQVTLSCTASVNDGGTVRYQWYRNDMDVLDYAEMLPGESTNFYTPEELIGTYYYYCTTWNVNGDQISGFTFSDIVAVTYTETEATPEPVVEATPEPAEAADAASDTAASDTPSVAPAKESNTKIIVTGVVICFAILAICATIIILKNSIHKSKAEDDDFEVDPESYEFPESDDDTEKK